MGSVLSEIVDFTVPAGMHEMTAEEAAKFLGHNPGEESCGLRSAENHTNIAIVYKKRHFLLGRLASDEADLKATEKKVQKKIPGYEHTGYGRRTADGKELLTFSCRYSVDGNVQIGEYAMYRAPGYFCSFECVCGEEYREFAQGALAELLESVKFKK